MRAKVSQYFFVIMELVRKELKKQHNEAKLGALWNVANPLLFMIVMSSLYGTIFKHDIDNFQVYFMIGYVFYSLYRSATNQAMEALVSNKMFLVRTRLPQNIFVLEKVCFAFINFIYSLIALVLLCVFFHVKITSMIVFFIPDVILTIFIVIGIGKILSVVYVFFADIKYLYSIFMTLVLFGSALFYPADRLTGIMRTILEINPVYISITIARDSIMHGQVPLNRHWLYLIIWAFITYGFGTLLFKKKTENIVQYL